MTQSSPQIVLNPLSRADGSVQWKHNQTTLLVGVNGPMEAARIRDENPSEAVVEVVVRPAVGVTSTREKYIEERMKAALKPVILRGLHPRKVIQIVVQIVEVEEGGSDTAILPALLNSAMLALLCAGVQLSTTIFSILAMELEDGSITCSTDVLPKRSRYKSIHALGFEATGNLLFNESEGDFDEGEWAKAIDAGRRDALDGVQTLIRDSIKTKLEKDLRWRQ